MNSNEGEEGGRSAGVLLHPGSLPEGTLGKGARHFVDWLADCGFGRWQMLPIGPTHADGSPYNSLSAFAGNVDLLCLEEINACTGIEADEILPARGNGVDDILAASFRQFDQHASSAQREQYEQFRARHAFWLDDYVLFCCLRRRFGGLAWQDWPSSLRDRESQALAKASSESWEEIEWQAFGQYLFFLQWRALKDYAAGNGVALIGDMPFFVALDSADVWAGREMFDLDDHGRPNTVAGVPPDHFSDSGQVWGNPHYQWSTLRQDGFGWWIRRAEHLASLFDLIRIDHFRGLEAVWRIPAGNATAESGQWTDVPGGELLSILSGRFGTLPFIAEDLGIITPAVNALRKRHSLPGMRVLQFAFDGSGDNPHLPHCHERNCVVYTGTHDNDTTQGWYQCQDEATRRLAQAYLGFPGEPLPAALLRCALRSVADCAILPMQDLLAQGSEYRMNTPGTVGGSNWRYRFLWDQVPADLSDQLRHLLRLYARQTQIM